MVKKTGLGKGLDALFGTDALGNVPEEIKEGESIQSIKLIKIEPNKDQPRKKFDEESLQELANSITRYGVIQPIIVNPKEDYFQIVAGERRWRAAKIAGLTDIPCIVRDTDERRSKEIALIENVQRQDLNPIEKARGYRMLIEDYGLTQSELADVVGMNRSTVANTMRLLNLDPRVIELAVEGKLTEGHCRSLLTIVDGEKQLQMAKRLIERGATVREAEEKAYRKGNKKTDEKYEAIYRDIEDSFQSFFGTKVRLAAGKRRGKIVIEYTSNDDLERILDLIK